MIKVLMSLIHNKKDGAKYYRDRNGNFRVYV